MNQILLDDIMSFDHKEPRNFLTSINLGICTEPQQQKKIIMMTSVNGYTPMSGRRGPSEGHMKQPHTKRLWAEEESASNSTSEVCFSLLSTFSPFHSGPNPNLQSSPPLGHSSQLASLLETLFPLLKPP